MESERIRKSLTNRGIAHELSAISGALGEVEAQSKEECKELVGELKKKIDSLIFKLRNGTMERE